MVTGTGRRTAISTSKIRNKRVIIKNRREKEFRILWAGSNPHSNGELFSRFLALLNFNNHEIIFSRSKIAEVRNKNVKRILLFIV